MLKIQSKDAQLLQFEGQTYEEKDFQRVFLL
jgi:hypothetical protein